MFCLLHSSIHSGREARVTLLCKQVEWTCGASALRSDGLGTLCLFTFPFFLLYFPFPLLEYSLLIVCPFLTKARSFFSMRRKNHAFMYYLCASIRSEVIEVIFDETNKKPNNFLPTLEFWDIGHFPFFPELLLPSSRSVYDIFNQVLPYVFRTFGNYNAPNLLQIFCSLYQHSMRNIPAKYHAKLRPDFSSHIKSSLILHDIFFKTLLRDGCFFFTKQYIKRCRVKINRFPILQRFLYARTH